MSRLRDALTLRTLADRDRRAVLLGLAVLMPVLLYVVAVRPYRAALTDLRERAAAEHALLQREEALITGAEAAPDNIAGVDARADNAAMRLVHAPNVPLAEAEVTGMLETLATLSRVLLTEMRGVEPPRAREDDDVASIRPLRLAVRGESDLEGVLLFLQRIETNPLLLRVVELSVEPARQPRGEGAANGVVQFGITVEAYTPADEVTS